VSNLPGSWEVCTLQDVGGIVSGGTPSTKNPDFWGDEVPWISPSDLTGYTKKFILRGAKSLTKLGLEKSSAKLMPAGSVHFSSRAPIGYVAVSSQSLCTNQGFKSLVPAPGVFNEYVYFYLKSIRGLANSLATGTTFKELSGKAFAKLPFPLPPLAEQKRIVSKIEELFSELDAGEESLRRARRQLGVYRQSLLKQAFEGKLTAPWRAQHPDLLESPDQLLARIQSERQTRSQQQLKEWENAGGGRGKPKKPTPLSASSNPQLLNGSIPDCWLATSLGNLIDEPAYGTSKKCGYETGSTGVLRIPNVVNGAIDPEDLKFADFNEAERETYALQTGDLLMIRSNGSVSIVGRCAVVETKHADYLYAGYLIRLRPLEGVIDSRFLLSQLSSMMLRSQIEFAAKSTSGVNNINSKEIQRLHLALPSLPEQQEIVRLLDGQFEVIEQNEREIDAALKRSEALRQSILKKAFTGHLVPQDPTDEPASTLLDRIRKERETTTKGSNKAIRRTKIHP
jgi:type I restriction enzyme S subunit